MNWWKKRKVLVLYQELTKLVERISGGKDGGGSKLTQEGEELLEKYEKFIQEMNEYAKIRFKEIFEDE